MAKIKITDLPADKKISTEEMRKVMGGFNPQPEPPAYRSFNDRTSIWKPILFNPKLMEPPDD